MYGMLDVVFFVPFGIEPSGVEKRSTTANGFEFLAGFWG